MPAPSSSGEAGAAAERFRSHWWHADHLALMAGRLELGRARRVLDLGCGAGQWAAALAPLLAGDSLLIGLDRSASALQSAGAVRYRVRGDARQLPLADASLDLVTGQTVLMHLDDPGAALAEAYRVLRPGGRLMVLEFSQIPNPGLQWAYDRYSFNVIPAMGQAIAGDRDSYQYLVESIRRFPDQDTFLGMVRTAGFEQAKYRNLTLGVACLHSGWKL